MTVSRDIDAFWQELNKRPSKTHRQNVAEIPTIDCTHLKSWSNTTRPQVDHHDQHLSLTAAASNETGNTVYRDIKLEDLEQHTQRPLQMLKDPAAAVRSRGIQRIRVSYC